MANQLLDVKASARALLGDPLQDWADDAYLMPLIAQAYDQAILYLKNTCSPFIEQLVEALNLPSGVTALVGGQNNPTTNQPIKEPFPGLINPLQLEWKQAGTPESWYQFAIQKDVLPNFTPITSASLTPSGVSAGRVYWEYRGYKIYVTPLIFPTDWRCRGEYVPPPLLKDTDYVQIHPLMARALGYAVAALAGGERINATYIQNWSAQATSMYDDISADLIRQGQGTTVRMGRMAGRRGGRGNWGYGQQT